MNTTPSEMLENIQEKYMSALQLHSGIGDQDTGAVNLALGMALCDLDAAWQREYDLLMVSVNTLQHDNEHLAAKVGAVTAATVASWRNGNGDGMFYTGVVLSAPPFLGGADPAPAATVATTEEADDGDAPLTLATPDEDEEIAPFRFRWEGLPTYALAAIADMELGVRPWRVFPTETRRTITLAAIRELQAAQYDGAPLTTAEYNRSKPQWMPNYSTLFSTLAMTWKQMLEAASSTTA